jgi:D-inositol-3-phosphate glycosyltransferase
MSRKKIRLALITQDLRNGGGVEMMGRFLYTYLQKTLQFEVDVLAYAPFKFQPELSVSLLNILKKAPTLGSATVSYKGLEQQVIGAYFPEFEPQRYKSNSLWLKKLQSYDIVQLAAGSASQGYCILESKKKFISWVATTLYDDRKDRIANLKPPYKTYEDRIAKRLEQYERAVLMRSEMVLPLSNYTKKMILALGDFASHLNIGVVSPVPVDTDLFHPNKSVKRESVVMVGRFNDPRKNLPLLLKAYAKLKAKKNSLPRLKIAGEKQPNSEFLSLINTLKLQDDVVFCGTLSLSGLIQLYQEAKVFVLPSMQEGQGIVVVEAMACGTPVISTKCGGPEMLIHHGQDGLLVENNRVDDMAEKLDVLLSDDNFQKTLSEAAREKVIREFSSEVIGRRFIKLYTETYPQLF